MDFNQVDNQINNSISQLTRALFYETQFRNALVSNALSFYDINLTKDLIENDFFYKDQDGIPSSVLERVGLSAPCKFSDFIKSWVKLMIPSSSRVQMYYVSHLRSKLIKLYEEGKRDFTESYWAETPEGRKIYISNKFLLIKNEDNDICALSIAKDLTEEITIKNRNHQDQIERYAYCDPVTQGYNYNKFKEKLIKYNQAGAIISLDIHSFKVINSICGINKGDDVIKCIWECLLKNIEKDKNELAAHINADHFIIFMPGFDPLELIQKTKNITYALNLMSSELEIPQLQPYFGIASWNPEKSIELAYSESVSAKRKAKNLVKQNYSIFEEKDTQKLIEEKRLTDSFEEALAKKDFKIWYQPKYNPTTKELVGAEALIRWQQADGTMLSPGVFIPLFEQNGLIRTLDSYVFRNVCEQQKTWKEMGKNIVPISINLSRASLYYQNVVIQYQRMANEINIETKYLPIEITESAAVNNSDIKEIADQFYKAGFELHMDDFGTGYSSLASLNVMHIETLKLDKSLIDYIGNFGGNRLLEHTISLAKELGIHVTAEGVEKEDQVSFLQTTGCDSIQGYYFSKPVPPEEFEKILDSQKPSEQPHYDSITRHIKNFKNYKMKKTSYSFIVNITKDTYSELPESDFAEWKNDKNKSPLTYQTGINQYAEQYVHPDSLKIYHRYMDRQNWIENYFGSDVTLIFSYKRQSENKIENMNVIGHLFKVEDSDDLWLYFTDSVVD